MIGASGRLFISGRAEGVARARDHITQVLEGIQGRGH
jgi:hypothetical protein